MNNSIDFPPHPAIAKMNQSIFGLYDIDIFPLI